MVVLLENGKFISFCHTFCYPDSFIILYGAQAQPQHIYKILNPPSNIGGATYTKLNRFIYIHESMLYIHKLYTMMAVPFRWRKKWCHETESRIITKYHICQWHIIRYSIIWHALYQIVIIVSFWLWTFSEFVKYYQIKWSLFFHLKCTLYMLYTW